MTSGLPLRRLFFWLGLRSSGCRRRRVGGGLWEDGKGYDVRGGGVVAQAQEEAGFVGTGERESRADEALGDGRGCGEAGVGGDGVDEVEAGAGDGAGKGRVRGAVEIGEGGEADEGDQGKPVAGRAVGR